MRSGIAGQTSAPRRRAVPSNPNSSSNSSSNPTHPPSYETAIAATANDDHVDRRPTSVSLLHPRIAVAIGISEKWFPYIFGCRLLSIAPSLWWGLPCLLRFVAQLHYLMMGSDSGILGVTFDHDLGAGGCHRSFEARLRVIETFLAILWCGASGFLSFFFTDCVMSRWLVNYTPQATIVRLLTINALSAYLESRLLYLTGGSQDSRLLLPTWIGIATTLTVIYHVAQRKINIRKETSRVVYIFFIASYISMVALLIQLYPNRADYPDIPIMTFLSKARRHFLCAATQMFEYGNVTTKTAVYRA